MIYRNLIVDEDVYTPAQVGEINKICKKKRIEVFTKDGKLLARADIIYSVEQVIDIVGEAAIFIGGEDTSGNF
jgi:hypothetical protein